MDVESRSATLKTPDGVMPLHIARPKNGAGKLPAVIVIQEAFGLNAHIKEVAGRVAAEGYHAVAPNLYYREDGKVVGYNELQDAIGLMMRLTDDHVLTDLRSLVTHLAGDSQVRADRIGIMGFCMGGRVSYLAACEIPEIRASIPFYGGGIAGQQMGGGTPPVARTAKMKAAIMLHFGENDAYIPPAAIEETRQALEREKKTFEIHVYKGAGHGFFCNERPDYQADGAHLAWERTLSFFARHLKA
jgi:carboxymethylenebutenolidase